MDFQNVLVETQDGLTWLTLNRPDKFNALSRDLIREGRRRSGDHRREPGNAGGDHQSPRAGTFVPGTICRK